MFGVLASGRLVNTNVQQAAPNQFFFTLEHVEGIHHIVVFLTGQIPFAEGFGGSIYFGWAVGSEIAWQLLGYITNDKPSAIFKISKVRPTEVSISPFGGDTMETMGEVSAQNALLGISVEPLALILQQTPADNTQPSTLEPFVDFTQKMLQNFVNYASSFAVSPAIARLSPNETYISSSVLERWYANFQHKLQMDPYFWKT